MYRIWPLLILIALGMTARADDKPSDAKLVAIQKEFAEVESAYLKDTSALPDTSEGDKKASELWKVFDKKQGELFLKAVELARANPKSDVAFEALQWVLTKPRAYWLSAGKPAMELAAVHHATNPKIGKIIAWLGYYPPNVSAESYKAAFVLIEAVAQKNPDRTARGQAIMALAWEAKRKFQLAEYRKGKDAEELAAEAEKAFESVLKGFADCPSLLRQDNRILSADASQELFELRHLRIAKIAPDIDGEDLDGVRFKLSDYRGKVVVVDFWGDW